jgi:methyltransferase (TIGR00027 family)
MAQIEHISDTARWVAYYRAMETERPDAIFRDPYAARLAGERGRQIVETMPRGRSSAWAMIVRTAVFDEVILDRVRSGGVDTVLNLAAGLDARAWRLAVPPTLRWIDVDLPAILEYKTDLLKNETPVCRYEAVTLDLRDEAKRRALFSQVGASSRRTLVVTEGLLIYLTPEQVGSLARDLHAAPSFKWWLVDLANPRLLKLMERSWGKRLAEGNAPFRFAPAEGSRFFDAFGWSELEYHSTFDDAQRLRREMPMMWFFRLLTRLRSAKVREEFRRFSGAVLLERR